MGKYLCSVFLLFLFWSLLPLNAQKKGFEVIPIKQDNNLYKCVVWNKEKCLGLGKYEYKEWHDAVNKTSLKIYEKLK